MNFDLRYIRNTRKIGKKIAAGPEIESGPSAAELMLLPMSYPVTTLITASRVPETTAAQQLHGRLFANIRLL